MADKNVTSRALQNTNSVPKWLAEAEKRAQQLVDEFAPLCVKLKALKPQIEKVQADFKKLKGSQMILGCGSFKHFCEKKLDRTEQAVYAMLGDYSDKQKAKKNRGTHKPTTHENLNLVSEDVERMRTGLNAAVRHFEAEAAGDETKAEEAKQEFLGIAEAESLKSTIFFRVVTPTFSRIPIDFLLQLGITAMQVNACATTSAEKKKSAWMFSSKNSGASHTLRIRLSGWWAHSASVRF